MMRNALGVELNPAEERLAMCYRALAELLENQRDELAPFEERNAVKALAALWQAMNGMDLDPGQIYDLGA